jgi:hypothetical protein
MLHHLLKSYVGSKISILSAAKNVSGTLMYVCDDYSVVETSPEVIDIVRNAHIVALEGLKYDTFLAASGRKREALSSDMLTRSGQLATQAV